MSRNTNTRLTVPYDPYAAYNEEEEENKACQDARCVRIQNLAEQYMALVAETFRTAGQTQGRVVKLEDLIKLAELRGGLNELLDEAERDGNTADLPLLRTVRSRLQSRQGPFRELLRLAERLCSRCGDYASRSPSPQPRREDERQLIFDPATGEFEESPSPSSPSPPPLLARNFRNVQRLGLARPLPTNVNNELFFD